MEKTKVIETKYGKIQGYIDKGIKTFKGIPYTSPPVGDLRFKSPVPPKTWSGVRDTTDFSPICPQPSYDLDKSGKTTKKKQIHEQDEANCLTLNIWTPELDNEKRPVMFWIHGGGFEGGSSAEESYSGLALSLRGNVVIVTINYRLGPLGYFYIPGKTANVGQLDQIAALQWVQDNIQLFGGDPDNVTIFGESAGGTAIVTLLAMPAAKGLFHRAISQSAYCFNLTDHKEGSDNFSSMLKINPGDIHSLQKVPIDEIIKTHISFIGENKKKGIDNPFSPVVDGKILIENPLKAFQNGVAKDIPLLIGTTRDEMKYMEEKLGTNISEVTSEVLLKRIKFCLKDEQLAKNLINTYIKEREGILPNEPKDILGVFQTDFYFRILSIRVAEAKSRHQKNTYMYLFSWPSPWMNGKLGACHALDIPFVFGNLDKPGMDIFCGKGKDTETLSERMMDTWIAFAHSGDPNNKNIPEWPSYDSVNRSTMILDKELKIENDPFGKEREAWEQFNFK
ncbi:MAG: carboxylesterase/lipase family protein [Promethearchaeota archaeon]|jgi:para-nitrobenzyl esterase